MTNKIIEAAREAGQYADAEYRRAWEEASDGASWQQNRDARFYAIAYRAGMERAAVECDEMSQMYAGMAPGANDGRYDFKADAAEDCAAAIRAEAHAQNQPKNAHDGSVV